MLSIAIKFISNIWKGRRQYFCISVELSYSLINKDIENIDLNLYNRIHVSYLWKLFIGFYQIHKVEISSVFLLNSEHPHAPPLSVTDRSQDRPLQASAPTTLPTLPLLMSVLRPRHAAGTDWQGVDTSAVGDLSATLVYIWFVFPFLVKFLFGFFFSFEEKIIKKAKASSTDSDFQICWNSSSFVQHLRHWMSR